MRRGLQDGLATPQRSSLLMMGMKAIYKIHSIIFYLCVMSRQDAAREDVLKMFSMLSTADDLALFEKYFRSPSLTAPFKLYKRLPNRRGNYRKYTLGEKQSAVQQLTDGHDPNNISLHSGIPKRNLMRWKRNGCSRKEGGGRPTDTLMENTLYRQIYTKQIIGELEIRREAVRLSRMGDLFKASKGWYCKFLRRYTNWLRKEEVNSLQKDEETLRSEAGAGDELKSVDLMRDANEMDITHS